MSKEEMKERMAVLETKMDFVIKLMWILLGAFGVQFVNSIFKIIKI